MNIEEMKKVLDNRKVIIGIYVTEDRNRQTGKLFANCGFKFLLIECEHDLYNLETVVDMITVFSLSGIVPIVKNGYYSYTSFSKYLDVGTERFILPRIRTKDEVEQGVGVIMISSELPEILGMSDRIVVIHEWEIKGEFDGDKATQEKLLMRAYQDENRRLESNYGT